MQAADTARAVLSCPCPGTFSGQLWVDVELWMALELQLGHHHLASPQQDLLQGIMSRDSWQISCSHSHFLGQYKGKSTLSHLQEERQRKRLKVLRQKYQEIGNPPLNCKNVEGILHSPLLCFHTGSLVISAGGISVLEKQAVVARDTMISSEGSQLPSPAQCHSCCQAWGASAHACKITLFNFLFL